MTNPEARRLGLGQEILGREDLAAEPEVWAMETPPQKRERICAHCGRICGNTEGGFASYNGEPLCHPNEEGRPDCYKLVQAGHPMPCLACLRDDAMKDVTKIVDEWVDKYGEAEGF